MKYKIQNKETGTIIDEFATLEAAQKELEAYESSDKAEGIYEPDFYEIVEADQQ